MLEQPIQNNQESIGINNTALNETRLQEKLRNLLPVSGGTINTERDEMGNILLYEDPNNIGSNKQLVTQWISIDLARRDYDDVQLNKVFDTDINELFKLSKIKTAAELRAEMERLRQLLAAASGDIIIQQTDGEGGTSGTSGTSGTGGQVEFIELQSDDRIPPFTLNIEGGYTIKIQTAIWDTESRIIRPNEIDLPGQAVRYSIIKYNATNQIVGTFETRVANPLFFQGWYYDRENLGNTQNYVSLENQSPIVSIDFTKDREFNEGPEKEFTLAIAYKNNAPPVETRDSIRVQMEAYDPVKNVFLGNRDDINVDFDWTLRGVSPRSGNGTNPFYLGALPGQQLNVRIVAAQHILKAPLLGWYIINSSDQKILLSGATGYFNNIITFTIPSDIKGLIAAYNGLV